MSNQKSSDKDATICTMTQQRRDQTKPKNDFYLKFIEPPCHEIQNQSRSVKSEWNRD